MSSMHRMVDVGCSFLFISSVEHLSPCLAASHSCLIHMVLFLMPDKDCLSSICDSKSFFEFSAQKRSPIKSMPHSMLFVYSSFEHQMRRNSHASTSNVYANYFTGMMSFFNGGEWISMVHQSNPAVNWNVVRTSTVPPPVTSTCHSITLQTKTQKRVQ